MATEVQKNLVDKNADYSSKFGKLADLPKAPSKHYVVGTKPNEEPQSLPCVSGAAKLQAVTCMDSRIDPVKAFGIDPGDAHVIRNAGASAADALRSVLISHHLLGTVEVLLVKHTGCGMLTFDNEGGRQAIASSLGDACKDEHRQELGKIDLLPFGDLEGAVKDDVKYLKEHGLIKEGVKVSGWMYDVGNGKVSQVA